MRIGIKAARPAQRRTGYVPPLPHPSWSGLDRVPGAVSAVTADDFWAKLKL